ncbi:Ssl1-like-domain-containing protein [Phyllosticta citriasiana]|uniref:Ssl1-like-domain-containing protein n=1 Tax=Phyllosticta citriasiana TaxID=595635 RepID=UPI0030FD81E6
MADSDGDFVYGSDDNLVQTNDYGTRAKGKKRGNGHSGRGKERWEQGVQDMLREGADGRLLPDEEDNPEAKKRKRLRQDTKPFQRGIIRHVVLVIDQSEAMLDKDFRPNRYLAVLKYAQEYVGEFFEQNPISQMCVMGMYDGFCNRVSELSGNPNDHITPLRKLRDTRQADYQEPRGSPSLQNALEQCRAALYHTPSHGTREVIIVLGALLSVDPGDIFATIRACVKDKIRVNIIGMGGRLKICQEICARTNGGDETVYGVALDQLHFRDLLMATTTPPVIRQTASTTTTTTTTTSTTAADANANPASLLMMGFPSRITEHDPTICACHGALTRGGYLCSRCKAKVCALPATCPSCGLTLILSTHLARSYHHLFPLRNWAPVSWHRARQVASSECASCLTPFPPVPGAESTPAAEEAEADTEATAAESSRYECDSCGCHFCVDCDLFCHEVAHNCPGCLSGIVKGGAGAGEVDKDKKKNGVSIR